MGRHDDIKPDQLRADLRRFAQFLLRMDEEGRLLEATPRVMKMMGDLRSKLFAYEVRGTGRLAPSEPDADEADASADPALQDAERIVNDAMKRAREARKEWERPGDWEPGGEG